MRLYHFLLLKCRFCHLHHRLFLCNLIRRLALALQGSRATADTQRQVGCLCIVMRVSSRVACLMAALTGMRALAVAPRWPKQALQRGRRVLRRCFRITQQDGALMIGIGRTGDLLHTLTGAENTSKHQKEGGLKIQAVFKLQWHLKMYKKSRNMSEHHKPCHISSQKYNETDIEVIFTVWHYFQGIHSIFPSNCHYCNVKKLIYYLNVLK